VAGKVRETSALVIKSHQVPVVDVRIHLLDRKDFISFRPGWRRNAKVEMVTMCIHCCILIVGLLVLV
jgi:hypothetical protein